MKKPDKTSDSGNSLINRRNFIATSGAALAGAAVVTSPYSKVMAASSYNKIGGANDRIRIGVIGCGGMGTGHIRHFTRDDNAFANMTNTEITAVSEIYEPRKERAELFSGGKLFHEYGELLNSGLVDAVIIAAPEHWHYQMASDAVKAGVDIYLQKAMTRTFEEAKKLYEEVSASDRVFQLGSQYMQTPTWWRAKELFDEGLLGKVTMCQTSYCRNSQNGEWNYNIDDEARPGENLDWEAFLGPLPYMEYDPEYYFRWRKYKPFSAGIITDLLPHKIHSISHVIGPRFPKRVTAVGGQYVHHDRDVADTVLVTIEYDDFTMMVAGSTVNETGLEDMVRGHHGNLYMAGNSVRLIPERTYADEFDPIEERVEPAPMNSHLIHLREWIDAMRDRTQPSWSIEPSYKVMTAIAMAETAYWEKRTVEFDEASQAVV